MVATTNILIVAPNTHATACVGVCALLLLLDQGERRSVDTCNKLGEFTITGVERARKGEPKVQRAD